MHSDALTDAAKTNTTGNTQTQGNWLANPAQLSIRAAVVIIIGVTLWRIFGLWFDTTDLFVDEAQYWLWSTHLDFGYYSKPPMIAWVIHAVTHVFGSNDIFWIRVSGPVLYMLTSFVLMAASGNFGNRHVQALVGVTFVTLPGVAFSSVFFSTDVVLLFFLAIALWAYFSLTKRRSLLLAVIFGLAFAGAFLSKYAILFMLPGGLIALALLPDSRIGWRDFFVASIFAILGALPNLWWNFANQLTTVRHTESIAGWSALSVHPLGALSFFAAQFGVVGPIVFFAMLWAAYRLVRGQATTQEKLLFWLSAPVVLLITLQAFLAKAEANWGVTAYVAGTILAVLILYSFWQKGLRHSLVINGTVSILLPLGIIFAQDLHLPNGNSVLKRYLGRADVSREAANVANEAKLGIIVSEDRDLLADMFYTLRDTSLKIYAKPQPGFPDNYYEQIFTLPSSITEPVVFVSMNPLNCSSATPILLKGWQPVSGVYKGKTLYAYSTTPRCLAP